MTQRIISAKYGAESDYFDVTHILRLLQMNNICKITVGSEVFTDDPAPKRQKELIIKFGHKKFKRYPEGSVCMFEPEQMVFQQRTDTDKVNKIMAKFKDIYYGCSGNYMTVTSIIRNHIELGNTEIKINTINMHHDHCYGKVKNLMAICADGRIIYIAYNNIFHVDMIASNKSIYRSQIKHAFVCYDRDIMDVTEYIDDKKNIQVDDIINKLNPDAVLKILMTNGNTYIYNESHKVNILN